MSFGRSRRPFCVHKRAISLDDQLDSQLDFTQDETRDSDSVTASEDSLRIRFQKLLSSEELADVHFLVGLNDRQLRIPAHRLVLAVGSPVLRELMTDRKSEVVLEDVEPHVFLEILRYLYCDAIHVNKRNAIQILFCAKRFAIDSLARQTNQWIKNNLSQTTCLSIWLSSKSSEEKDFEFISLKFIERFAEKVFLSSDLLKADINSLQELLQNDLLRVSELNIFIGVMRWAKNTCLRSGLCPTRANIRHVLKDLIPLIRFPLMTEEDIRGRVQSEGVLEDDVLRSLLPSGHRSWPRLGAALSKPFPSRRRAFQRLQSPLLTVQRFGSFDNQLSNRCSNRCLAFSANKQIFLSAIGVYGPKKGCAFYIEVALTVSKSDENASVLDHVTQNAFFKCDGSQPILTVKLDQPFDIEPHVQYEVRAQLSATSRRIQRSKLVGGGALYWRAQELNFYYGTEALFAAKVRTEDKQTVIFNFSEPHEECQIVDVSSAPPTPNPPPRPPPPKEYRRPSRIERLKRALSFSDKPEMRDESQVCGGQIPVLMFFA